MLRTTLLAAALLTLFASAAAAQDAPPSDADAAQARTANRDGLRAHARADYERSRTLFAEATERDPAM